MEERTAWQFTRDNFEEGVPDFIRNDKNITLFSNYGGKRIGGEVQTPDGIIRIFENDIIEVRDDVTYVIHCGKGVYL